MRTTALQGVLSKIIKKNPSGVNLALLVTRMIPTDNASLPLNLAIRVNSNLSFRLQRNHNSVRIKI